MKITYIFLLVLYFSSCNNSVDSRQNLNHLNPNIDNISCRCESDRNIMTPQFIDEQNGYYFCFDDIKSYYDEFESRNFRIYSCDSAALLFDSKNKPFTIGISDTIINLKLNVMVPNITQIFSQNNDRPLYYDQPFFSYTFNKRTKKLVGNLMKRNIELNYFESLKLEYERNMDNVSHLKSEDFIVKLLLVAWAFPLDTKQIYLDVESKIKDAQILEDDAAYLDLYQDEFRLIYK